MTKERELLHRVLEVIEQTPCWTYNGKPMCGFEDLESIYDEIKAYLAAEKGKQTSYCKECLTYNGHQDGCNKIAEEGK